MDQEQGLTIGERMRSVRRFRGMTLDQLSAKTGLSKSFLSMVENGQRTLTRRSHLDAIVDALQVSPTELTGQPYTRVDKMLSSAHTKIPALRLALMDSTLDDPSDVPARPISALADQVSRAREWRRTSNYTELGELLPGLIAELQVRAATGDGHEQQTALRLLIQACQAAHTMLKYLGYPDLEWMAADQARQAAARLGDPVWIGVAEFLRCIALMDARARQRALRCAVRAADPLQAHLDDRLAAEMYGMLHLTAALANATLVKPDTAQDHLAEAAEIATRIGECPVEPLHMNFGPTNVGIWRLTIAMELGDADRAVAVAQDVTPERIDAPTRQAMFHCDLGRAYAQVPGKERQAVEHLRKAERLAPQRIRSYPPARDTVTVMLNRAKAAAGGRELRGIAYRMGIPH